MVGCFWFLRIPHVKSLMNIKTPPHHPLTRVPNPVHNPNLTPPLTKTPGLHFIINHSPVFKCTAQKSFHDIISCQYGKPVAYIQLQAAAAAEAVEEAMEAAGASVEAAAAAAAWCVSLIHKAWPKLWTVNVGKSAANTLLEHKNKAVVKNKQSSVAVTQESIEHVEETWHLPEPNLSLERRPGLEEGGGG